MILKDCSFSPWLFGPPTSVRQYNLNPIHRKNHSQPFKVEVNALFTTETRHKSNGAVQCSVKFKEFFINDYRIEYRLSNNR